MKKKSVSTERRDNIQQRLVISEVMPEFTGMTFDLDGDEYIIGEKSENQTLFMRNLPEGVIHTGKQQQYYAVGNGQTIEILLYWYKRMQGEYSVILEVTVGMPNIH